MKIIVSHSPKAIQASTTTEDVIKDYERVSGLGLKVAADGDVVVSFLLIPVITVVHVSLNIKQL